MENYQYLLNNYNEVLQTVGKYPQKVDLVTAVKYATDEEVQYLVDNCHVLKLGENRVQQLLAHKELLKSKPIEWHFIGHLQKNKVKYVVGQVTLIHSVDTVELALEIDKQSKKIGVITDVLIEINVAHEESKSGFDLGEVAEAVKEIEMMNNVRLLGFMAMGSKDATHDENHRQFSEMIHICKDVWYHQLHREGTPIFSIGMSSNYQDALDCGSNLIRIGRKLFERNEQS